MVNKNMESPSKPEVQGEDIDPKAFYAVIGRLVSHKLMPVYVGPRLVVVPKESPYAGMNDEIVIRINQDKTDAFINKAGVVVNLDGESPDSQHANAFGSGSHPSTRLALNLLEDYISKSDKVIDIGTGSGVLAIYAAKLGAEFVLGLDVDEIAIEIAKENVGLNEVESIVSVASGSLDFVRKQKNHPRLEANQADILVANLLTTIILELIENGMSSAVKSEGCIILTGILQEEVGTVVEKLELFGYSIVDKRELGNWGAIVAAPIPFDQKELE